MFKTVVTLAALCSVVQSSGVHHAAAIANAPVVTASSSQYFERTFNRLVAPPVFVEQSPQFIPVQPVQPVQSVAVQPVTHLHPVPSFQTVHSIPLQPQPQQPLQPQPQQPLQPQPPVQPQQPQPPQPDPNIATAIAIANAAAPVSTILLPPYPFGFPPSFGFIPQEQPNNVEKNKEETTTQNPTTQLELNPTTGEPETTTQEPAGSDNNAVQARPSNQDVNFRQYLAPSPQPSNQDVNFRQYMPPFPQPSNQGVNFRQYMPPSPQPSNQDVNFRQYLAPSPQPSNQDINFKQYLAPNPQQPQHQLPLALPQPQPHHHHHHHHPNTHIHVHPKKLRTLVEVQRVPLAYIAPPPLPHFENNHQAIKIVKHIHTFVPSRAKLIIRPVSPLKTRSVPVTGYQSSANNRYNPSPLPLRNIAPRSQNLRPFNTKDMEQTTFRPFSIPNKKPPRL